MAPVIVHGTRNLKQNRRFLGSRVFNVLETRVDRMRGRMPHVAEELNVVFYTLSLTMSTLPGTYQF